MIREKQIVCEILEGDIMKVAGDVAQELHLSSQVDQKLRPVTSAAIEVYQKISELVNSLNQSIEEMNETQP